MATYAEKLSHPYWQRVRLEIMQRDNFKCVRCKATTITLHVHHLTYEYGRDPWDYPESNFITLCETCHNKEHKPKQVFQVIGELLKPLPVITLIEDQINSLQTKLRQSIPNDLEEDILKNIMYLQTKKRELMKL
ncbi:MAG: HNH endonuclease [Bacteroidota bacterium]